MLTGLFGFTGPVLATQGSLFALAIIFFCPITQLGPSYRSRVARRFRITE